jgi:hypothetical protein
MQDALSTKSPGPWRLDFVEEKVDRSLSEPRYFVPYGSESEILKRVICVGSALLFADPHTKYVCSVQDPVPRFSFRSIVESSSYKIVKQ